MRTKARLTLWLGIVTLLVLVLAIVGLGTIWKLRTENQDVLKANYNSIEYARIMLAALDEPSGSKMAMGTFAEALGSQRANVTEPGEQELTDRLVVAFNTFRSDPVRDDVRRVVRGHVYGLIDINRNAIVIKSKAVEASADKALMWISVVGTLCFLIAFTLFFSLPELIAEPIRKLTEGIDRIAEGHYRERVELKGGGEFAHMADRFNAMAIELERWENSSLARIMEEKARAEAVINSLQDASIGVDDKGRVLFINRQAVELLGLQDMETTGRSASEIAKGNDLLRFVLEGRGSEPFKVVLAGKENYFVRGSNEILGPEGPLGTVHTMRNITPHKELDAAKTSFIATVSHELKTPIASILMSTGLLRDARIGPMNEEQRQLTTNVHRDAERLLRITSELLNLTQVESGHVQMRLSDEPVETIVNYALDANRSAAETRNIRVTATMPSTIGKVRADGEKAAWTLNNFLSNAVRYSDPGSAVAITVARIGKEVEFTVQDNGPGIDPQYVDRVFDRYFRIPGSVAEGTGLGLAIGKEFVEAMGGRIGVWSEPRKGSRFWFTLPAAADQS
ncbi:MAG: HAMP domain-containing protein [Flavobacteriales bacterium]|nr:HAMP domain-containing protein [Flavobacteriales bacterium]